MQGVFISRDLDPDSPFRQILSSEAYRIYDQSLVTFSAVGFTSPPPADWVFFYSSRSVEFFLHGLTRLGLQPDRYAHYAALGQGTAKRLLELGIVPDFTGSGAPEATAAAFLEKAKGQIVLFPRAEQSRQSIQRLLSGRLSMLDLVVYHNEKMEKFTLPDTDYVVLTSPLNAQAYAAGKGFSKHQRIVAIGNTTAKALDQLGVRDYRIAARASEADLAETVLNWEKL